MRAATLFALTATGTTSLRDRGLTATRLLHHVVDRSVGPPLKDRPLAVGLFGYSYGGKGFELLHALRSELSTQIGIEVAGRGTENLDLPPGTKRWGPISNEREDDFFSSVRCLLLPYESGGRYGPFLSASGAAARAFAYGTPIVAAPVRGFTEDAKLSRAIQLAASGSAKDLTYAVSSLINSEQLLSHSDEDTLRLRNERTVGATAGRMVAKWRQLLSET